MMTNNDNTAEKVKAPKLSDAEVEAYLRENPDFLERHTELLDDIITPGSADGKGVVDFQMIMVEKLKAEKKAMTSQQRELIEATQFNVDNWGRIQAACLAILEADDFEDLVNILSQDIPMILDIDVCCLVIESYGNEVPAFKHPCLSIVTPGAVKDRLGKGGYALLHGDIHGDPDIYGPSTDRVKSEALLRLDIAPKSHKGIIAFASEDAEMFSPEQDIEQIAFFGQVLERFIRQFIKL